MRAAAPSTRARRLSPGTATAERLGRRSRQRRTEGRQVPASVAQLAGEWKAFTRGEALFVALVGVGIVVLAFTVPGGVVNGFISAVSLGLVAGGVIAVSRRRRRKHTS